MPTPTSNMVHQTPIYACLARPWWGGGRSDTGGFHHRCRRCAMRSQTDPASQPPKTRRPDLSDSPRASPEEGGSLPSILVDPAPLAGACAPRS
eukprot:scaffold275428_cov27-Tisochrysis_lutea.AAC.5